MIRFLFLNLKKGAEKIISSPQLIYTIVIAILITGSFIFMAERFIGIANDAQERLINVRIGSLQDAFVTFAADNIDDPLYLNKKIENIINSNETIKSFKVIVKKTITTPVMDSEKNSNSGIIESSYIVIASNKTEEMDKIDNDVSFLYTLASSDKTNSITIFLNEGNERLFKTARAITDDFGNVLGVVITTQTLSLADIVIQNNITNSRILLLFIVLLILFLFFRHSKIIDYMDLYKKLKELDQLKDDFISMASHELRTPLTVISGYAEFLKEDSSLSKANIEYVTKIYVSARSLEALVGDILDVSKIEQGKMPFKIEKINPKDIIENICNSFILSAKEKDLSLHFDKIGIEDNQYINIDIERFKQVLVNLIGNAIKYTNKGEIIVKQYKDKDMLYIRISDTGIGMTEEERLKLFQKFYRIRTDDTYKIRGTGLGLWITYKIVKEMGGNISVESIKGVGSHFVISFKIVN